ncbi:hypothetical protein [Leifsonia sp. TF02-11]|uniref:hypothetical protein n=1 Tax=Leifsonia sp. TF02-11 TaxID=2815212 RepID=UPI001AA10EA6|nr:hypothetical protein [Leifsonia sp. TF02-11]MBO1739576.1 hypothetical protein [Leifsonia sp. TF02-11]
MTESRQGPLWLLRILSAIVLAVTGGIHLFLIFDGVGGLLGTLFVLNGIAGIVLAVGMLVLRGTWLRVATILSLLFLIASLAALLLALTVGLFGITEVWSFTLVPETVVIEAIGIVVLAVTSGVAMRRGERVSFGGDGR